jgi:uncharacterized protein (TIRG00374 family)
MRTIFKIILAISLFIVLAIFTDLNSALNELKNIKINTLIGCGSLLILQIGFASYRWKLILNTMRLKITFSTCFQIYWAGMFFNQILPTSMGGDAIRAMMITKNDVALHQAIASIFIERFIGLGILMIAGLVYLHYLMVDISVPINYVLFPIGIFVCLFVFVFNWVSKSKFQKVAKFIASTAQELITFVKIFRTQPIIFLRIILLSSASHLSVITAVWLILQDLNGYIDIVFVVGGMSATMVLSALPVSISGWGVREGVMAILLNPAGVPSSVAVATGIALGTLSIICSLPGGVFYAKR